MKKVKICKKCSSIDSEAMKESLKDSNVTISHGCIGQCGLHENSTKVKAKFNGNVIEADTHEDLSNKIKNMAKSNNNLPTKNKGGSKGKLTKILMILAVCALAFYILTKLFPIKDVGDKDKLKRQFTQEEQNLISTKKFTLEEVSKYDGKDGRKGYIIIDDKVFDVTDLWESGRHHGAKAGNDLTETFVNSNHALKTYEKLPVVGGVKK